MRNIPKEPNDTPFGVFLWGGKDRFLRRAEILKVYNSTPAFSKELFTPPSLARKDVWTRAVMQARELIAIKYKYGWDHRQFIEAIRFLDDSLPVLPQFRSMSASLLLMRHQDTDWPVWISFSLEPGTTDVRRTESTMDSTG